MEEETAAVVLFAAQQAAIDKLNNWELQSNSSFIEQEFHCELDYEKCEASKLNESTSSRKSIVRFQDELEQQLLPAEQFVEYSGISSHGVSSQVADSTGGNVELRTTAQMPEKPILRKRSSQACLFIQNEMAQEPYKSNEDEGIWQRKSSTEVPLNETFTIERSTLREIVDKQTDYSANISNWKLQDECEETQKSDAPSEVREKERIVSEDESHVMELEDNYEEIEEQLRESEDHRKIDSESSGNISLSSDNQTKIRETNKLGFNETCDSFDRASDNEAEDSEIELDTKQYKESKLASLSECSHSTSEEDSHQQTSFGLDQFQPITASAEDEVAKDVFSDDENEKRKLEKCQEPRRNSEENDESLTSNVQTLAEPNVQYKEHELQLLEEKDKIITRDHQVSAYEENQSKSETPASLESETMNLTSGHNRIDMDTRIRKYNALRHKIENYSTDISDEESKCRESRQPTDVAKVSEERKAPPQEAPATPKALGRSSKYSEQLDSDTKVAFGENDDQPVIETCEESVANRRCFCICFNRFNCNTIHPE